ncbi:hypothetical protein LY76DRAFT_361847 [Colletotrichum caudatum]|nr:hypothetical protein LY76DRAFT_361847 [Colletotrichum caudatum]
MRNTSSSTSSTLPTYYNGCVSTLTYIHSDAIACTDSRPSPKVGIPRYQEPLQLLFESSCQPASALHAPPHAMPCHSPHTHTHCDLRTAKQSRRSSRRFLFSTFPVIVSQLFVHNPLMSFRAK